MQGRLLQRKSCWTMDAPLAEKEKMQQKLKKLELANKKLKQKQVASDVPPGAEADEGRQEILDEIRK